MIIIRCETPLAWGALDLPLFAIPRDWAGTSMSPAPSYSLAIDKARLWFLAHHRLPADLHPLSRPGAFVEGLWNHDVSELFLADPDSGRYLEFNLAPNGAWWMGEFTAPRVRQQGGPMPEVATFADLAPDGSWLAALSLPLDLLGARIGIGASTRANVTMILGSADRRHLSATPLPGEVPDFHQPDAFFPVRFLPKESLLPDAPPDLP